MVWAQRILNGLILQNEGRVCPSGGRKLTDFDRKDQDEYKENPLANVKDSYDRAQTGDMRPLSQLGWWPSLIIILVIVIFLVFYMVEK
jgi:Family of unknown function (DUF6366)